jgi:hypothetical protein
MRIQTIRVKLREDLGKMTVRRRTSGGEWGMKQIWTTRHKSDLPRAMFHTIRDYVRQPIIRCEDARDYVCLRKMTRRALYEAAESSACTAEFGKEGADVAWYLEQTPLIGFHIATTESVSPAVEKLLAGNTIFRWTIVLVKNGFFRIHAWGTNPKWRFAATPFGLAD